MKDAILTRVRTEVKEDPDYLFGPNTPARSLSAKIRIGFSLGVFDEFIRDDLECIREVRNAFAHTMLDITFATEQVTNVCARLKSFERFGGSGEWDKRARGSYLLTATFLTFALHDFAKELSNSWTAVLHSSE